MIHDPGVVDALQWWRLDLAKYAAKLLDVMTHRWLDTETGHGPGARVDESFK